MFGPKSKGNKNMSLKYIVENDPIIKTIDKKISYMNEKSTEDMIKNILKCRRCFKNIGLIWFWTTFKSEADWKVYFTKFKSEANLKVYLTKFKSEAIMK